MPPAPLRRDPEGSLAGVPMPPSTALAIAIGGAVGALVRLALAELVPVAGVPWGTLMANLAGTAVLATLVGLAPRLATGSRLVPALGPGLAGALTTFSTLQVETLRLGAESGPAAAAAYLGVSILAGLAVAVGCLRLVRGRAAPT